MLALSIGSLLPFIRDARGLDYAFCGLIVSLHSVGNLISSFAAGMLPVFVGRKKSILLFNAFFTISYLLIIFGNNNLCIAFAFFMTGLARGATSNFCNTTINSLAPGKAWIINGLHAMFSIGAFTFPILLTVLTAAEPAQWIYACYFMLAMGILSWILYYMIPIENAKIERQEKGSNFDFFKEPLFYLCTMTLFFYLCAEQGVIGWMITYFKDTGLLNASLSQITASVLWIMILAGRLTTAWLSTKMQKGRLLLVMGVGIVIFFFLLLFSRSTPWIAFGIMGFGYSMAGIYPTTVSFSGNLIQKYPVAWSFILTLASIGSIVMPSVIGRIAENAGIFYGMSSIVAVVFIDMGCIISLVAYVRRHHVEE
ncbi:MAG: MFS transporter [Clostridiales bacterium]|nr:MFS transporter [Clostridiales bacterium]